MFDVLCPVTPLGVPLDVWLPPQKEVSLWPGSSLCYNVVLKLAIAETSCLPTNGHSDIIIIEQNSETSY